MAVVIPINLPIVVSKILRVISLYPPEPAFQGSFDISNNAVLPLAATLQRDISMTSFGFPHSIDGPFNLIDGPGVFSIPPNAYAIVLPSFISNQLTNNSYSVLLLDVEATPIEPGISRLRVDYLDVNGNPNAAYLDMPFYPGWNVHPREIEEMAEYEKEAVLFENKEINNLSRPIGQAYFRMLPKGLIGSGTLWATAALQGVTPPMIPHSLPSFEISEDLNSKFLNLTIEKKKHLPLNLEAKNLTFTASITSISPIYSFAGSTIVVGVDTAPIAGDDVYLNGFPLGATFNTTKGQFSAVVPNTVTMPYAFPFYIGHNQLQKTGFFYKKIYALPVITSISATNNNFGTFNSFFTIIGRNFDINQGTVTFNGGVSATITSWNDSFVQGIVPSNSKSGLVTLTTAGNKSATTGFNIISANAANTLVISPDIQLLLPNSTVQYNALFNNNTIVASWSLVDDSGNIGSGTLAHGNITTNGIYTAPININAPFSLSVAANFTTVSGNYYAQNAITVIPVPAVNTLTLSPSGVILHISNSQQFKVFNGNTPVTSGLEFFINGFVGGTSKLGVIDFTGLYIAPPGVPTNNSINLIVLSQNLSATATIKIIP